MKSIDVKGTARVAGGKKAARELRKQDMVPCNLYGEKRGENGLPVAEAFACSNAELRNLIYTPHIYSVNLNIDGVERKAVMREIQFHPVSDRVLHIDFLQVVESKPIVMEVPVRLEGHAAGVRAGGKLSLEMRKLRVKGLAAAIPEKLVINIDDLGLGKTIQVKDLHFDNLELLNGLQSVVCSVKLTRAAMGNAAAAAAGK